ncbi:MAG: flavoprotein [Sedimentibacter sp.]|jgi:predicted Rossmann fold flavoprotein|nr:flavoprotein [Sedimentibacter sp.]
MKYDVIVIGAGAAGLFAALSIKGKSVLLLEKNNAAGRKVLLSGAGQCNYTNSCEMSEFLTRYGEKGRFLKTALFGFTNKNAMEFFEKSGVIAITREDGKVFPASFKSTDIVDALIEHCKKNNVKIAYEESVEKVSRDEEKNMFLVKTGKATHAGTNLIIAVGGKSYPNTGSSGDGYDLAKSLGHTIEQPKPCLAPVYVESYPFKDLSGISFENIKISLWRNNKKIKEFSGDMLLTHVNISGPVILNNSRYMEKKDMLKINFTHFPNAEEFKTHFEKMIFSSGKYNVKTVLKSLDMPKRFTDKIMEMADIHEDKLCSELDKSKRKKLMEMLCEHSLTVERLGDYNIAMATKGGVSTSEINQKTMESKIVPGLYFAGEVMDYDGDTGGFNIQAAFSTGHLAAESISKKLIAQDGLNNKIL